MFRSGRRTAEIPEMVKFSGVLDGQVSRCGIATSESGQSLFQCQDEMTG